MTRTTTPHDALRLARHPSSEASAVRAISANVRVEGLPHGGAGRALVATWHLDADLAALRIPPSAPARAVEGLWRHTCFEFFVRRGAHPEYREGNFSPSSEWALYGFERTRTGMHAIEPRRAAPAVIVEIGPSALVLTARVSHEDAVGRHAASGAPQDDELRLNIAAVIEARDGTLSYWALTHPDPLRPDFHHPDGFVHEIRHRPAHE